MKSVETPIKILEVNLVKSSGPIYVKKIDNNFKIYRNTYKIFIMILAILFCRKRLKFS